MLPNHSLAGEATTQSARSQAPGPASGYAYGHGSSSCQVIRPSLTATYERRGIPRTFRLGLAFGSVPDDGLVDMRQRPQGFAGLCRCLVDAVRSVTAHILLTAPDNVARQGSCHDGRTSSQSATPRPAPPQNASNIARAFSELTTFPCITFASCPTEAAWLLGQCSPLSIIFKVTELDKLPRSPGLFLLGWKSFNSQVSGNIITAIHIWRKAS